MQAKVTTLVLSAVLASVAACGGEDATSAPPQVPPPPPPVAPADPAPPPAPAAETPAAPAPSLNDKMLAALKAMGDAQNAHDAAKVAALYAPDASMKAAGMPPRSGSESVAAEWKQVFESFPDAKFAARRVFVKDDVAVMEWTMVGTNTGPAPMGAKPTGKAVGFYGLSVLAFNGDGLVKEERAYWDMPTMMGQLGMVPKGGPKARELAKLPDAPPEVHLAKGTPTESANVDKAKSVDKAYEAHDEKAFLDATADDIVWDDLTAPAPASGKKEAQKSFETATKAFPDMKMDCSVWGFDDWVVQECTMNATSKGAIVMGPTRIAPTNKPVSFHGVDVMQIKDGKATKGWSYGNGMEFAMQLGLIKAPHQPKMPEDAKKAPIKDVAKAPAKDTAKAPKK